MRKNLTATEKLPVSKFLVTNASFLTKVDFRAPSALSTGQIGAHMSTKDGFRVKLSSLLLSCRKKGCHKTWPLDKNYRKFLFCKKHLFWLPVALAGTTVLSQEHSSSCFFIGIACQCRASYGAKGFPTAPRWKKFLSEILFCLAEADVFHVLPSHHSFGPSWSVI